MAATYGPISALIDDVLVVRLVLERVYLFAHNNLVTLGILDRSQIIHLESNTTIQSLCFDVALETRKSSLFHSDSVGQVTDPIQHPRSQSLTTIRPVHLDFVQVDTTDVRIRFAFAVLRSLGIGIELEHDLSCYRTGWWSRIFLDQSGPFDQGG